MGASIQAAPAYHERAGSYERDTAAFQPYREAVVEALPLRRGQVVLDVGCGTGLCCGLLRDKVGPQGSVVGIEESPEMAAVAREHIADEGWDNVTVMQVPAASRMTSYSISRHPATERSTSTWLIGDAASPVSTVSA